MSFRTFSLDDCVSHLQESDSMPISTSRRLPGQKFLRATSGARLPLPEELGIDSYLYSLDIMTSPEKRGQGAAARLVEHVVGSEGRTRNLLCLIPPAIRYFEPVLLRNGYVQLKNGPDCRLFLRKAGPVA
jgi:hypothetical protein